MSISTNAIIGDLMTLEKYRFVDHRLLAEIVNDVVDKIEKGDIIEEFNEGDTK